MNRTVLRVLACATALAAGASALAASTAKAALPQVVAAAKKWKSDAVITHVSTLAGKPDGKASSWLYTVYSPSANKSAIVTAKDTQVELEEVLRNASIDAIGTDYLDSDKALDAARKAGLKTGNGDIMFGLTLFGKATRKPAIYWTVTVTSADGMSSVTLDPKDGTLVKRDDVKLK
jgi:hypothetical protein